MLESVTVEKPVAGRNVDKISQEHNDEEKWVTAVSGRCDDNELLIVAGGLFELAFVAVSDAIGAADFAARRLLESKTHQSDRYSSFLF